MSTDEISTSIWGVTFGKSEKLLHCRGSTGHDLPIGRVDRGKISKIGKKQKDGDAKYLRCLPTVAGRVQGHSCENVEGRRPETFVAPLLLHPIPSQAKAGSRRMATG